jgi:outer membrane biosynthesis protein TonB
MSDEPKISARYRELPSEEPPRHLDDTILAAARRAAEVRPAPLVVPSGRRKWYFPLAAAAIIVLAVAVTVHVERERPDPELVATSPTAPREEPRVMQAPPAAVPAPAPVRKAAPPPKEFVPDPQPQAVPAPAPAPAPATPPAAADSTAQARVEEERQAAAAARMQAERRRARAVQEQAADAPPEAPAAAKAMRRAPEESRREVSGLGGFAYRSPEQWLQGIDDLKRQGRHDEAEKQLAEFRKRYPDYRIPEAILEKFEKR